MAAPERNEQYSIARAATLTAGISLLSPIAGLFVEIALAARFGSSGVVDAYRTCSLVITFGTALFFTFLLPHLVVPMLAEYRARGEEAEGWRIALTFGNLVTLAGLAAALLVWLDPAPLGRWLGPGLTGVAWTETQSLLRYFTLACVATLWCGVAGGILNVHRIFMVTPFTQMLANVSMAAGVAALAPWTGGSAIAIGVCAGFSLMVIIHARLLLKVSRIAGIPLARALRPGSWPGALRLMRTGIPLSIMIVASILPNAILNRYLSLLPTGNLAQFGYANKLLVMIAFGPTALAMVAFPSLSEAKARGDEVLFRKLATRSIHVTVLLTVALSGLLYPLKEPLVRLLFNHGAMDAAAIHRTAEVFGILLLQAVPGSLIYLLYKISFSQGDNIAPAIPPCFTAVALYFILAPAMAWRGSDGILLAFDVVQWVAMLALLIYQIVRFRMVSATGLLRYVIILAPVFAVVYGTSALVDRFFASGTGGPGATLLELVLAGSLATLTGYAAVCLLGLEEGREIRRFAMARLARPAAPTARF